MMSRIPVIITQRICSPNAPPSLNVRSRCRSANIEAKLCIESCVPLLPHQVALEVLPERYYPVRTLPLEHTSTASGLRQHTRLAETTVNSEYRLKLKDECRVENRVPEVKTLHTKSQGAPTSCNLLTSSSISQ